MLRAITKMAPPVIVVSVEGNIGAGKSTLMRELRRLYDSSATTTHDVAVILEPIEEWCKPVLRNGDSMLRAYYSSMGNALAFQMFVLLTRIQQLDEEASVGRGGGRPAVLLVERGPWSTVPLFGQPMRDMGLLSEAELHVFGAWVDWALRRPSCSVPSRPAATIYVRGSPDISAERIGMRAREGESAIDAAYLSRLHDAHEAYCSSMPADSLLVVDATEHSVVDSARAVMAFVDRLVVNTSP